VRFHNAEQHEIAYVYVAVRFSLLLIIMCMLISRMAKMSESKAARIFQLQTYTYLIFTKY
jgi:hypothetical protein